MTGCASKIITIKSKPGIDAAKDGDEDTKRRRTGGDSKGAFGRSGSFGAAKPSPEKSESSFDENSNSLSGKAVAFLASFASNVIEKKCSFWYFLFNKISMITISWISGFWRCSSFQGLWWSVGFQGCGGF